MKALFVETTGFSEAREDYLSDEGYAVLQQMLMDDPTKGQVIPGTGGLRKLRIGDVQRGKGKRGGSRVIYLHILEAKRFYMIDVYGKDEQDDLSPEDKKDFKQLVAAIKKAAIAQYKKSAKETES